MADGEYICQWTIMKFGCEGEHLRQVSTQSDQWSRRRCDNEIVTELSKGEFAHSMMATVQPY